MAKPVHVEREQKMNKLNVFAPDVDQMKVPALGVSLKIKTGSSSTTEVAEVNKVRVTYSQLFHEIQFRATKNALMNYHASEELERRSFYFKCCANLLTAASASGIFVSFFHGNKTDGNKLGFAGFIGLMMSGFVHFLEESTSSLIPSFSERAKKHTTAAAGWMNVAETARVQRLRIRVDPDYSVDEMAEVHKELIEKKEEVSKLVLIPRATHRLFAENPDDVYLAMKKRNVAYAQFLQLEKQYKNIETDLDEADYIYF